jgi:hypothetical protein
MKFTSYVLSEKPVDFDSIGIAALPTVVFAVPFLTWVLCGALLMDGGRIIRLKYLLRQRELRCERYIKCVLRSLDCEVTRENVKLLKVA